MKKAVIFLVFISLLVTAFAVTSNAYEVITNVSSDDTIGTTYELSYFQLRPTQYASFYKALTEYCMNNMVFNSQSVGEGNLQLQVDFNSNNRIYNYIWLHWAVDDEYNRPVISMGYTYFIILNNVPVGMNMLLLEYVYTSDTVYTPITFNGNLGEIIVYGGEDYNNPKFLSLLSTIFGVVVENDTNTDTEIIDDIKNGTEQTTFINYMNSIMPSAIAGASALFYLAYQCIYTSEINQLITIIMFGGMAIYLFKAVSHFNGGHEPRKENDRDIRKH